MSESASATFGTRREAELVVERLVQTLDLDRKAIQVAPEGQENTVGDRASGGDLKAADPGTEARTDAPVEGRIVVTVATTSPQDADAVQAVFKEFNGSQTTRAAAADEAR
jgi:hypothetical protein